MDSRYYRTVKPLSLDMQILIEGYLEEIKEDKNVSVVDWQLCPKCNGQGIVSKPPWIAGDQTTWSETTQLTHQCNLCNGNKVILKSQLIQSDKGEVKELTFYPLSDKNVEDKKDWSWLEDHDIKEGSFHTQDRLFFMRGENGSVTVIKRTDDFNFEQTLDADTWVSVISATSKYYHSTSAGYMSAKALHLGQLPEQKYGNDVIESFAKVANKTIKDYEKYAKSLEDKIAELEKQHPSHDWEEMQKMGWGENPLQPKTTIEDCETQIEYWKGRLSDLENLMGMSGREGEIDSFALLVEEDKKKGLFRFLICPNCKFEYSEDDYINQICNRCDFDSKTNI